MPDDGGRQRFAARFPLVWHVAEAEALDGGIFAHGLLPAAALRSMAGIPASTACRRDFERIELPQGPAVLRFQQMDDAALTRTLRGDFADRPDSWREMIDQKVFFWTTPERRDRFRMATTRRRARSAVPSLRPPVVLEAVTSTLLDALGHAAEFACINSGSTVRGGGRARRDQTVFRAVDAYGREKAVELTINGAVPYDILTLA